MRAGGDLLAALAVDLLDEVAVLGLAIVRILDLSLAIELDQKVAARHACAGLDQPNDDQRPRARTGESGHDDGVTPEGLDGALQAQR